MKGASEISGRAEFKFIMQIVRAFIRMGELTTSVKPAGPDVISGCHSLALSLASTWSFDKPVVTALPNSAIPTVAALEAKLTPLRPSFNLQSIRRRSSVVIDIDLPSLPPTDPPSPNPAFSGGLPRSINEPLAPLDPLSH